MRALQVHGFKTAPVLADIDLGPPGPGEVKVNVSACGLNFADLLMIKGEYQETPTPPFTLGLESSGTIIEIGAGVTDFAKGGRVAVFGAYGGLAEEMIAPTSACHPLPDGVSMEDAAALQIAYGTSHLALTLRANLKPAETLLVLGAAGGVGLTAVEIGAALGAHVIAVARGDAKLAVAREAGAHDLIDADDPDLKDKLRAAGGVDVIYDPVGGKLGETALKACKRGGRYLVIGFASGDIPEVKLNHLLVKNIALHGFYWGGYDVFDPAPMRRSLGELMEMLAAGKISPHIGLRAPLDDAASALEALRKRQTTGKVVIMMDKP